MQRSHHSKWHSKTISNKGMSRTTARESRLDQKSCNQRQSLDTVTLGYVIQFPSCYTCERTIYGQTWATARYSSIHPEVTHCTIVCRKLHDLWHWLYALVGQSRRNAQTLTLCRVYMQFTLTVCILTHPISGDVKVSSTRTRCRCKGQCRCCSSLT